MTEQLSEAGVELPLSPLTPHKSLTDEVVAILRARILSGYFRSGEQLVQAEVARHLGVSRGPVREALNQLKAEGLVHEEPRRGTFVNRPEATDVRDAMDLRLALEIRAAHLVIDRQDPSAWADVEKALQTLVSAVHKEHPSGIGDADFAFHDALCRASGNKLLHSVFANQAKTVMVLVRVDELTYVSKPEILIEEHQTLFDCLKSGDKERMQKLLTEHIETVRDRIVSAM